MVGEYTVLISSLLLMNCVNKTALLNQNDKKLFKPSIKFKFDTCHSWSLYWAATCLVREPCEALPFIQFHRSDVYYTPLKGYLPFTAIFVDFFVTKRVNFL